MKKIFIILFLILFAILSYSEIVKEIVKENDTYTKEDFIFAQISFANGDNIDNTDITNSIRNLQKTKLFGNIEFICFKSDSGFFEKIDNSTLNKENTLDTIIVKFKAEETLVLLPLIGLSYDADNGYAFTIGISFGNLWKIRHVIDFSATFGYYTQFAFNYTIPSLYSRPYNSRMTIAFMKKNRVDLDITEHHKNILIGFGYSTNPDITPEIIVGYDRVSFDNDTFSIAYHSNEDPPIDYDEYFITGLNITIDKRDNIEYPENGAYIISKYAYNYMPGDVYISRWHETADMRFYYKLPFGVLAMRHLFNLQDGTCAYYNLLEAPSLENRAIANSNLIAFNRYSGSLEYRMKIPYTEYKDNVPVLGAFYIGLMSVLFTDWSYIANDINDLALTDFDNYQYGVGGGLRVYSNIFNVAGCDIGYDLKNKTIKYSILVFSWNF